MKKIIAGVISALMLSSGIVSAAAKTIDIADTKDSGQIILESKEDIGTQPTKDPDAEYVNQDVLDQMYTFSEDAGSMEKVEKLMDQRGELLVKLKSDEEKNELSDEESTSIIAEVDQIDEQLAENGAERLSADEVARITDKNYDPEASNNSALMTRAAVPDQPKDSWDVHWFKVTQRTCNAKGDTFDIVHIYAQSIDHGRLANAVQNTDLYAKDFPIADQIISVMAQKVIGEAVGYIPVIKWIPYEILYPELSKPLNLQSVNHTLTAYTHTTMCFTYMKSNFYNYWEKCFVTNKVLLNVWGDTYYALKGTSGTNRSSWYKEATIRGTYYSDNESFMRMFGGLHAEEVICSVVGTITATLDETQLKIVPRTCNSVSDLPYRAS